MLIKINLTKVDTCLHLCLKVASRVERRLNAIQNELRGDRDRHAYDRYDELLNLSTDLRQVREKSFLIFSEKRFLFVFLNFYIK